MKKALVIGGVVVALAVTVSAWPLPRTVPDDPSAVHFSDLPRSVYRSSVYRGRRVRVAYPLRLHPTADQLVWEFRPGTADLPPTHRVHFDDRPEFPIRLPVVVVGTVDGIEPDLTQRPNGVPGAVVIRSASVAP